MIDLILNNQFEINTIANQLLSMGDKLMPDLVLRKRVIQAIIFIYIECIIHKVLAYNDNIHIIIHICCRKSQQTDLLQF